MRRPWAMRWTGRTLALLLVTISLAAPALAEEDGAAGEGPTESSGAEPAPDENATAEPEAAPESPSPSPDAETTEEPSTSAPESSSTEDAAAAAADAEGADTESPAASQSAQSGPQPPDAEAEPTAEKESLSLVVQVGDVTLLIERPADDAAEIVVHVVETPDGSVDAAVDEDAVTVDASLVAGLIDSVVQAAEGAQPGTDQRFDEAIAALRTYTASAGAAWSVWDTGTLVVVVPTPTAPSGSGGSGPDDDGSAGTEGGEPCACETSPGGGDGGSPWAPTQEAARTVARFRDAAYGEVSQAVEELTQRLPVGPTPSTPSMPRQPVPGLTTDPTVPEGSEPAPTTAVAAARPEMSFAAKAAIATMALAGVAVPLASAGGAAPLAMHKSLAALRRLFAWFLGVPLYAKLKREQVTSHPVRENILALVQVEPGIHAQRLRRELDLGWGTLAHHLRVLQSWGLLVLQRDGNKVKAFPSEWSPAERRRAAALASPGTSQVYEAIAQRPGAEQRMVAQAVGRSHPTVIWHAERLEKAGLIRVERRGRRTAYFAVATPA